MTVNKKFYALIKIWLSNLPQGSLVTYNCYCILSSGWSGENFCSELKNHIFFYFYKNDYYFLPFSVTQDIVGSRQCDQIGRFLKDLCQSLTIVPQMTVTFGVTSTIKLLWLLLGADFWRKIVNSVINHLVTLVVDEILYFLVIIITENSPPPYGLLYYFRLDQLIRYSLLCCISCINLTVVE